MHQSPRPLADGESPAQQPDDQPETPPAVPVPAASLISLTDADEALRENHSQILAWAAVIVRRRVRGCLRDRALAELVPAVPGEVGRRLILAVRDGRVSRIDLRGFLYRLTERALMESVVRLWRTDRRERGEASGSQEPADEAPDPEALLIAREEERARASQRRLVRDALRGIPERERRLVQERFRSGPVAFRALGARLGMTEGAARIALFRALGSLRRSLDPRIRRNGGEAGAMSRSKESHHGTR